MAKIQAVYLQFKSENFDGVLGAVKFRNGVSEKPVNPREAKRLCIVANCRRISDKEALAILHGEDKTSPASLPKKESPKETSEEKTAKEEEQAREEIDLTKIKGIGKKTSKLLKELGFSSPEFILANQEKLEEELGENLAKKVVEFVNVDIEKTER